MRMVWALAGLLAVGGSAACGAEAGFKRVSYVDREVSGLEVFSLEVPKDWFFQGWMKWHMDRPGMPASLFFVAISPTGDERITAFPNRLCFWSTDPFAQRVRAVGSDYFGCEVRPVLTPEEVVRQLIIPSHLKEARDVRVVKCERNEAIEKMVGKPPAPPGVETDLRGGDVVVEFTLDGKPMAEYFAAAVETHKVRLMNMLAQVQTNTTWVVSFAASYRAPRGSFEERARAFEVALKTFRFNKVWYAKYRQLIDALMKVKRRELRTIQKMAGIMRKAQAEMSAMASKSYRLRTLAQAKMAGKFNKYLREGGGGAKKPKPR